MQSVSVGITAIQVLAVVGSLLQLLVVMIAVWLVRTTQENRDKINTIYTVIFGPGGPGSNAGLTHTLPKLESELGYLGRTAQRVVYRLGSIEDHLGIKRNINVGDTEDTNLNPK